MATECVKYTILGYDLSEYMNHIIPDNNSDEKIKEYEKLICGSEKYISLFQPTSNKLYVGFIISPNERNRIEYIDLPIIKNIVNKEIASRPLLFNCLDSVSLPCEIISFDIWQ